MVDLVARAPSVNWEMAVLPFSPPLSAFVWWKPPHRPTDLVLCVPLQTWMVRANELTPHRFAVALGLAVGQIVGWTIGGITQAVGNGTNPVWDRVIPLLPGDLTVNFHLAFAHQPPVVASPPVAAASPPVVAQSAAASDPLIGAIEADWTSIQQMDVHLDASRKQLSALHGKLLSLNRDLNIDENRFCDNQDRQAWRDARRWLREAAGNVQRYIKEADIGVVSGAGKRNHYEQLFQRVVVLRQPQTNLASVRADFEAHRKTVQTVLSQMQTTLSNASRDGEQRALQILNRIAVKVRQGKVKR